MRYTIFLLILIFSSGLSAQGKDYLDNKLKYLTQLLTLSQAQQTEIKPLFETYFKDLRALSESEEEREEKRNRFQTIKKEKETHINKLLTPAQQKIYKEYQQERLNSLSVQLLGYKLNLTEQQEQAITPIIKQANDALIKLKQEDSNRFSKALSARKILKKQDEAVFKILTDEQKELYEDYKEKRREKFKQAREKKN